MFDRLYLRLCLPAMRHGTAGARKRYAGLVETADGPRVVFTGMEAVRGDWTELAKQVQRELYARLFCDRPVDDYLREVVAELRAAGSTSGSSTASRCARPPRPTRRRPRRTWRRRARWPARRAGASPT